MIYDSWNIRYYRQTFSTFWAIFCPFSPLTTWKIKILTLKKTPGDITILHIFTINDNHMMYVSWDTKRDRHNFLSFWTVFCPNNPKNQNFEKMKKTPRDTIILHKCTINDNHMMYGSWDMKRGGQNFWHFEILKNWKKHLEISFYTKFNYLTLKFYLTIFHFGLFFALLAPPNIRVPKIMIRWCTASKIWCTTDGRRKKWHIEVGTPPKKSADLIQNFTARLG